MTPGERARKLLPNQPGVSYSSVFHAGIRVEKYVNAAIRRAVLAERKACADSVMAVPDGNGWANERVLGSGRYRDSLAKARDARRKRR